MRAKYTVTLAPAAARQLRKLDRAPIERIKIVLTLLADDPRPPGAKALTGRAGVLRVRTGEYRILYTVHDDRLRVLVIALGHRRDIYR